MPVAAPPSAVAEARPALRGANQLVKVFGCLALFMSISRFHQEFGFLAALSPALLCSATALLALVASGHEWGARDLTRHWVPKSVIALLCIAVLGVSTSIYPSQSLFAIKDAYARTILLGMIAWAISRTPGGARLMAKTVALAGVTTAVLALQAGRTDVTGRLSGAQTYDANDLALICVVSVPLIIWWVSDPRNRLRFLLLPAIPLLLYVVVETGSRGGGLGAIAVILALLTFYRRSKAPRRLRMVSNLVLVAMVAGLPFIPGDFVERMKSISSPDDYNRTSATGRTQVWKRGVGYALSNPVFGVGLYNFNTAEGTSDLAKELQSMGTGFKWSTAHNSFVQIGAELGVIAFFLFVMLLVRTIRNLCFRAGLPQEVELLGPMVGISFVGFSVSGFFLSFAYYDLIYILFGLAGGLLLMQAPAQPARPAGGKAAPPALQPRAS